MTERELALAKAGKEFVPGMIIEVTGGNIGIIVSVEDYQVNNMTGKVYYTNFLDTNNKPYQWPIYNGDIRELVKPLTSIKYNDNGSLSRGYIDYNYDYLIDIYGDHSIYLKDAILHSPHFGVGQIIQSSMAKCDIDPKPNSIDIELEESLFN